METKSKYFGTDGIRGIIKDELSPEFFWHVGKSLSLLNCKEVIVGTDTRKTRDIVRYSLITGALSVGLSVCFISIVTTPMLIFETMRRKCLGVMITASHNSEAYNGIKIVKNGVKIALEEQEKINEYLHAPYEISYSLGLYKEDFICQKYYLSYIKQFANPMDLKIVVDSANGSLCMYAKEVFAKVTDSIYYTGMDITQGINDHVGVTCISHLQEQVLKNQCDIGFSFDGDGDRILVVDKKGNVIDGDKIIYLLGRYFKNSGLLRNNKVALTIMSNPGMIQALKKIGIDSIVTNVGDQNVINCMKENELSIGGEASGHIILSDFFPSGDGLLIALVLLRILDETKIDLTDLKEIPLYSVQSLNLSSYPADLSIYDEELQKVRSNLMEGEQLIIRESGTEHVLRITVMACDDVRAKKYLNEIKGILKV